MLWMPILLLLLDLPKAPTVPPKAASEELENEVKNMTWVGFQQLKDASRVFVKTSDPVKYSVDTSHPNVVVLILANTRVPLTNNMRALPTHYFKSPVKQVEVRPIEGPSPSVRIEIFTAGRKAEYKAVQQDTLLALDFMRSSEDKAAGESSHGEDAQDDVPAAETEDVER